MKETFLVKKGVVLITFIFIVAIIVVSSVATSRAHLGEEEEIHVPISQPPMPPIPTFPTNTSKSMLGYVFVGVAVAGAGLIAWRFFKKKR
ncbi:MAG: hypothetical protein A2945_03235 [Candidatus Liptonbacteria bacterium RIFCSPLOWO2_01_FULL_52_25]|uniref:Gram-positive cocci surface proteins LPxTG domain-containing protein n=1 Tax=Candidatus Liptonbacteria bacterium RIFCSPLOWO2_01_FULL_52_25 TaxID=1798650 RepID=A0A1G2CE17_9BACT|nr:MAG: hypothetical protein A2945_03235 [Candidatus Liptonbacteria bacterium RIFCSPLOWO2_01_FULL_52_25]